MKKVAFVIGRFQGLHSGHCHLLCKAEEIADDVVVLLGSANRPPSIKNPFTAEQRANAIAEELPELVGEFVFLDDYKYNDARWIEQVQKHIARYHRMGYNVVLVGHWKDGNDYLKWFPGIEYHEVEMHGNLAGLDATSIREAMFTCRQEAVAHVQADWDYFQREKETFASYPYKETLNFACGDAVLECAGHVLLIQRKNAPGKGLWALPGGFKNNNETHFDCAIRELKEETNVRVSEKVLRGSVVQQQLFDSPTRGCGIPRHTLAVHMRIATDCVTDALPRANGADDAADVRWVPFNQIGKEYKLFDDHQDIIQVMCGI